MIELTRRCNIVCDHCLRGQLQNLDVKNEYITELLSNFTHIQNITLTGGEPSLNVKAIQHFISEIKRQKISLGHFYIATNAKIIKPEFLIAITELYTLCDDKEYCRIDVSNDYYHALEGAAEAGSIGRETLEMFKFTETKYQEEGFSHRDSAVNEGYYAENFGDGRELTPELIEVEEDYIRGDGQFYMNALGEIVSCCDLSYTSQKIKEEFHICNVFAADYTEEIKKYNRNCADFMDIELDEDEEEYSEAA